MTPLAEFLALIRRERDAWAAIADDREGHEARRLMAAHKRDVLDWTLWQARVAFREVGQ